MGVITISKEFSSGGVRLAELLAQELDYVLVGKRVLAGLAHELGISEAQAELLKRAKDAGLNRFIDSYIVSKPEAVLDDRRYFESVVKLVNDVAAEDNVVIVGWGGQKILAGHEGATHVRVVASLEDRATRLAEYNGIPLEQAKNECRRQDEFSMAYIKRYFKSDWSDPHLYHMVINTGLMGFDLPKALASVKTLL